jgi:acetyl-CoA acetyltransferase
MTSAKSVAYICEGVRTPIGRYGGALAQVRTDDLAAAPLKALRQRFDGSDREAIDEIILGRAGGGAAGEGGLQADFTRRAFAA